MRERMASLIRLGCLIGGSWMALPGVAGAFSFEDGDLTGSFDTTISWGALWRTEHQDSSIIGIANGGTAYSVNSDDGNQNYDTGIVSNAVKATHDLELNYKNLTFFLRGSYFYDFKNEDNDHIPKTARDRIGKDATILDAYLRTSFDIGRHPMELSLGQQVVNWGESTFIQGGINAVNPVDVTKLRVPGAEIREGLIPTNMLWGSFELASNVNMEWFYLLHFDYVKIDPRGAYFSTTDIASEGGRYVTTGFGKRDDAICPSPFCIPRADDRRAKNSGQFGMALRYLARNLNATEFGLYYLNYHSRLPLISTYAATSAAPSSALYFVEYPEDIHLFGASFNTQIKWGGIALQGEYSYRENIPLQVDDVELLLGTLCSPVSQLGPCPSGRGRELSGYRRHHLGQANLTATKTFGARNPFHAQQWVMLAEVAATKVYNLPDTSRLRYEGPGTFLPGNPAVATALRLPVQPGGFGEDLSWGYRFITRLDFDNALGPISLSPRIAFAHDVDGTSPGPGGNFIEGRKALGLGLGASYLNAWSADLSYTRFMGAGDYNLLHDRDFIAMNIKYAF